MTESNAQQGHDEPVDFGSLNLAMAQHVSKPREESVDWDDLARAEMRRDDGTEAVDFGNLNMVVSKKAEENLDLVDFDHLDVQKTKTGYGHFVMDEPGRAKSDEALDLGGLHQSLTQANAVAEAKYKPASDTPVMPSNYDKTEAHDPQTEAMRQHPALVRRYHIVRKLGEGSQGIMWMAFDKFKNEYVAVKSLSFETLTEWKSSELFLREIETLKSMNVRGTPQYIDAIDASKDEHPYYFLVQTLIPGKTLEDMLQEGYVFTPDDITAIALSVLPILSQLRKFTPPIVHRDIKPSNLMLTAEGDVFLIDFGASMLHEKSMGGTTVAGTAGYMAPEQCIGASGPESDIYSLGATLVHLLTGMPPWQMTLTTDMHLLFKSYLPLSTPQIVVQLLESMLDPLPAKRLNNLTKLVTLLEDLGGANRSTLFVAKRGQDLTGFAIAKSERIEDRLAEQQARKAVRVAFVPEPAFKGSFLFHIMWFFMVLIVSFKASFAGAYPSGLITLTTIVFIVIDLGLMFILMHAQRKYRQAQFEEFLKNQNKLKKGS